MTNEELESLAKEILDMRDDFYTRLIREPNARQWAIASLEDAARLVRSKIIKKRIKRTVWLNVYDNEVIHGGWRTKEEAQGYHEKNRIACLKLDLDFEEGEGL
jgi:hypothetical protein